MKRKPNAELIAKAIERDKHQRALAAQQRYRQTAAGRHYAETCAWFSAKCRRELEEHLGRQASRDS